MANKDFKVKNGLDISTPLPVSMGGTGQTSTNNTLNALLPSQVGNSTKVLQTDGTNTTWVTLPNGYLKGNTASRPGSPSIGDIYSNTQTGYIEVYTSGGWSQLGVIPTSATIGTATDVGTSRAYNDAAVDVTYTAGSGGGLVTSFTAQSTSGGYSASSLSSPIRVTGIASATTTTFTITATNGYGNALASTASNSVTATTVPQNPTMGTPTVATGQSYTGSANVSVPFTAGATGGKTVSTYTVTSSSGNTASGASSPISISDTVGTARTYTVTATNANGTSTASSASASTTPSSIPQAPTIGTATNTPSGRAYNNGAASITFTPGATGGSTVTGYTVTSTPGSFTGTGSSSPITVTGLQSSTQYTYTVTATNANGTSLASSATAGVTATTVPQAPTIGTATSGNAQASVTFTTNATGGSAITSYTVTSSPGNITGTGSSSPITVTGLTNNTAYTFTVTATNANGTSTASSASNSVTPVTPPGTNFTSYTPTFSGSGSYYTGSYTYGFEYYNGGYQMRGAYFNGYDMVAWAYGNATTWPTSWTHTMGPGTNSSVYGLHYANGYFIRTDGFGYSSSYGYSSSAGNDNSWTQSANIWQSYAGAPSFIRHDGSQYVVASIYNGSTPFMQTWAAINSAANSATVYNPSLTKATGGGWSTPYYFKNYYYFPTGSGTSGNGIYYRNGAGATGWTFLSATDPSNEYFRGTSNFAVRLVNGSTTYYYTTDGTTWNSGTLPSAMNYNSPKINPQTASAVFYLGSNNTLYRSGDGVTWTATNLTGSTWQYGIYTGQMYVFVPQQPVNTSNVTFNEVYSTN